MLTVLPALLLMGCSADFLMPGVHPNTPNYGQAPVPPQAPVEVKTTAWKCPGGCQGQCCCVDTQRCWQPGGCQAASHKAEADPYAVVLARVQGGERLVIQSGSPTGTIPAKYGTVDVVADIPGELPGYYTCYLAAGKPKMLRWQYVKVCFGDHCEMQWTPPAVEPAKVLGTGEVPASIPAPVTGVNPCSGGQCPAPARPRLFSRGIF